MKTNTKAARKEILKLVSTIGLDNILCSHMNEIHDKTKISYCELQNAVSYFNYSPQTAKYR